MINQVSFKNIFKIRGMAASVEQHQCVQDGEAYLRRENEKVVEGESCSHRAQGSLPKPCCGSATPCQSVTTSCEFLPSGTFVWHTSIHVGTGGTDEASPSIASEVRVITRLPSRSAESLPMTEACPDTSSLLLGNPPPYSQGRPRTPFSCDICPPPRISLTASSPSSTNMNAAPQSVPCDSIEDRPAELDRSSKTHSDSSSLVDPHSFISIEDLPMSRALEEPSVFHRAPRSPSNRDTDKRSKRDIFLHRLRKKTRKGLLGNNEVESSSGDLAAPMRLPAATSLPELMSQRVNGSPDSLSSSTPNRVGARQSRQGSRKAPSKILQSFMDLHEEWRREDHQLQQHSELEPSRSSVTVSMTKTDPPIGSRSLLSPQQSEQQQEHKRGRRSPRKIFLPDAIDHKDRGEAEYLSLFANELSRDAFPFLEATPRAVYTMLPGVPVALFDIHSHLEFCSLPGMNECEMADYVYGRRESNYPMDRDGTRQGDPICDAFGYLLFRDAAMLALTDGCGWGQGSANASLLAVQTYFQSFLTTSHAHLANLRTLGLLMVYCLSVAHCMLADAYLEGGQMGTTTFISSLAVRVQQATQSKPVPDQYVQELVHSRNRFYLITLSVGDCKAFHYSPTSRQVRDITRSNRADLCDPVDPGGRIGRLSLDNGDPDLRNLSLYFTPCVQGDFVFLMSDGIHDNFDPEMLGVDPAALGLICTEWANAPPAHVEAAKTTFMESLIGRVLAKARCSTPRQACRALLEHAASVSKTSRVFMESDQNRRLPTDYTLYPGKMDHSSVIAAIIGERLADERDEAPHARSTVLESLAKNSSP